MKITVTHTLADLESDMRKITIDAAAAIPGIVNRNIRRGTSLSRSFAAKSAGAHGKHYPRSIGSEMLGPTLGEWGPDPSMLQGGMSFEHGSRNQPPHLDLARAADIVAPKFGDDVRDLLDQLFWPR